MERVGGEKKEEGNRRGGATHKRIPGKGRGCLPSPRARADLSTRPEYSLFSCGSRAKSPSICSAYPANSLFLRLRLRPRCRRLTDYSVSRSSVVNLSGSC